MYTITTSFFFFPVLCISLFPSYLSAASIAVSVCLYYIPQNIRYTNYIIDTVIIPDIVVVVVFPLFFLPACPPVALLLPGSHIIS